jgi:hypothetical protein
VDIDLYILKDIQILSLHEYGKVVSEFPECPLCAYNKSKTVSVTGRAGL